VKKGKVVISILLHFFLLENQIANLRVFMISLSLLLSITHTKVSLVPDIFSSAVDRSWHFNQITQVEKIHKWGESGFFMKP
jgi:hypothetical protein